MSYFPVQVVFLQHQYQFSNTVNVFCSYHRNCDRNKKKFTLLLNWNDTEERQPELLTLYLYSLQFLRVHNEINPKGCSTRVHTGKMKHKQFCFRWGSQAMLIQVQWAMLVSYLSSQKQVSGNGTVGGFKLSTFPGFYFSKSLCKNKQQSGGFKYWNVDFAPYENVGQSSYTALVTS